MATDCLRVCVATRFPADPAAPRGGVESVSVNLVRALARLGDLRVEVVTTDPSCRAVRKQDFDGVTVYRLPRLGRTVLTDATGPGRRQMQRQVAELAPQVVHAHDVYGLMVKGLAVPRVFTVHGFIYADTRVSDSHLPRLRSLLWRWIEVRGWADQPHIISISPYVRERLSGVGPGRIHDIENPISARFFEIMRQEERGRIFSAAWISRRKNTLGLVRGFARLLARGVKAELRLAGPTFEWAYEQQVRRFVDEAGLGAHVCFLGPIDYAAVGEELSRASVFVLASLEENAPMGISEAMAAGVPVVASNRCGMPYMVRHGETGFLIDPQDPEDIARRLGALLADDELRVRMGCVSRREASNRFHPEVVARRTREVYLEAAGVMDSTTWQGATRLK